jgi:hypothetical protein
VLDRNHQDIAAGVLLAILGAGAALYSLSHYSMGTFTRMGPGMVPAWLGGALAVFGSVIAVQGLFQPGEEVRIRVRIILVLCASITCFALMIDPFGLVPTVFISAFIASCAEAPIKPVRSLTVALTLTALTWGVFIAGLRLNVPAVDWPF